MPHGYKKTDLFGGALTCDLPDNFADVSTIRKVPDNQEVYIDKDGFTSIIFDIGEDADTVKVWNTTETQFSRLDSSIPAYTLIATQTPRPRKPEDDAPRNAPDFTALILTLVRLEKEKTDVLITINVPHIKGEYDEEQVDMELGKQGELIGDAVEYAARIWATFAVHDWRLFGEV
ncbi:hypothetical protein N0V88_005580 [Collariella sp. IMI 366227]|nr:hypothetical protein N0V88_005580 [Collariella sp. IMI 366227]